MRIGVLDRNIIRSMRAASPWAARIALFVVFFWFGLLKPLGVSPAAGMVAALQLKTLPFIGTTVFLYALGAVEMLIGVLFLIPRAERVAIAVLVLHMATTFLPLIFLPEMTWQASFALTLEGQYIVKNVVIIALAIGIAAHLAPLHAAKLACPTCRRS